MNDYKSSFTDLNKQQKPKRNINSPFLPQDNEGRFEILADYISEIRNGLTILSYAVKSEKLEFLIYQMGHHTTNMLKVMEGLKKDSEGKE